MLFRWNMRKYFPFFLILIMILIILGSASVDGSTSYDTSKTLAGYIKKTLVFFGDNNNSVGTIDMVIRKLAHFMEYLLFTVLLAIGLFNVMRNKAAVITVSGIVSVIVSVIDEYFIQMASNRKSSLFDIMVDGMGILMAIVVLALHILFVKGHQK